jgi:hypothetical protein
MGQERGDRARRRAQEQPPLDRSLLKARRRSRVTHMRLLCAEGSTIVSRDSNHRHPATRLNHCLAQLWLNHRLGPFSAQLIASRSFSRARYTRLSTVVGRSPVSFAISAIVSSAP